MCEVTNKNFEELFPQIIDDLQSATFISIDCEFSGLFDDDLNYSFFDSPKARFEKLQKCLDIVRIIQFGLSTFKYERVNNTFAAASYSFYLKPSTVLKKQKFTYQLRSLEFLCKNNFDFNKLFYDGISYLNESYEKLALNLIEDRSFINFDTREELQKYCSRVAEWNGKASDGSEMSLELKDENKLFVYILHGEIRNRFPNIWTFFGENNIIKIKKLKDFDKMVLLSQEREENFLKKKLFDYILGFTKVIRELENLKKPIVGHNILMDLILIYKQFYNPLPVSYRNFKNAITKKFPNIYDTKVMSFRLRNILPKDNMWNSNNLSSLYSYLKVGKGATVVIFTPLVNHRNESFIKKGNFHDAAFDSYCTGHCFLKMAHIFSLWDYKENSFLLTSLPTSSKWLLGAVSDMKNQVNLPRGQVNYIVLDGDDPKSVRPSLLFIHSRSTQPLDISKISRILAKYASVDIQLLSSHSGLLAAGSQQQVRDIRKCFKNDEHYRVTKYNFLKHSKLGRGFMSGMMIFSIIIIAVYLKKNR